MFKFLFIPIKYNIKSDLLIKKKKNILRVIFYAPVPCITILVKVIIIVVNVHSDKCVEMIFCGN